MNALRAAIARLGVTTSDSGWSGNPSASPAPAGPPVDEALLAAPRPWKELDRLGLMPSSRVPAADNVGPLLTDSTRAGLLGVLGSLEKSGLHLAQSRYGPKGGPFIEYKTMSPASALALLESGPAVFPSRLYVVGPRIQPTALTTLGDLQVLDALHGPPGASAAPDAQLGEALRALADHGFTVTYNNGGETVDPLHAYNALTASSDGAGLRKGVEFFRATQREDVLALDFFSGSKVDRGLKNPALALGMRTLVEDGWSLRKNELAEVRPAPVERLYAELQTAGAQVRVEPPNGGVGFLADAALVSDAARTRARAAEVTSLFNEIVRPEVGKDQLKWAFQQAPFFGAVFGEFGDDAPADAARRLARLTRVMERPEIAVEVLGELRSAEGVDARVEDFCRIKRAGLSDDEARHASRYLVSDLPARATAEVTSAALHDTFLALLDHGRDRVGAQNALGMALLPVAGTTFADRAKAMIDIAACQEPGPDSPTITDYLAVVNQRRPDESLTASCARFVASYLPLKAALKDTRKAHEACQIVQVAVNEESQEDRTALITRLAEQGCERPLEAYYTIMVGRVPSQNLLQAGAHYLDIHEMLRGASVTEQTSRVFTSLQAAADPDGALRRFGETLVMSKDVDRALAAARDTQPRERSQIDGGSVTVGGIKLQRKVV